MPVIPVNPSPDKGCQRQLVPNPSRGEWLGGPLETGTPTQLDSPRHDSMASSASSSKQSRLLVGSIGHHRLRPVNHRFQFPMFMALIDLDEVDAVFRYPPLCSQSPWSVVQFRRSDYFGEAARPLAACVRELVTARLGITVTGPIRLLTHLRYFGHVFNPVSFYYCYACDGLTLQAIVADVTNTPWRERYAYVIPCDSEEGGSSRFECEKQFHVSPFMEMQQRYLWRTSPPGLSLSVDIENHDASGPIFRAALRLRSLPFSYPRLAWLLARFPFLTLQVALAIYWQALRLWIKRVPYVPHPHT